MLSALAGVRRQFNGSHAAQVSMADLIVLAGTAAVEAAARAAGLDGCAVPFCAGRTDATLADTDGASFDVLEPRADGFRNFLDAATFPGTPPESLLVDKAFMLKLTSPEMAVLLAGLRGLGVSDRAGSGVLTEAPGTLSNDFFVNLLDMGTTWSPAKSGGGGGDVFEGRDRSTGQLKWTGTRVDLIFGSNSELRAIAEYYGSADAKVEFLVAFIGAWTKVMNADRFDVSLTPEKIGEGEIAALKYKYLTSAAGPQARL